MTVELEGASQSRRILYNQVARLNLNSPNDDVELRALAMKVLPSEMASTLFARMKSRNSK